VFRLIDRCSSIPAPPPHHLMSYRPFQLPACADVRFAYWVPAPSEDCAEHNLDYYEAINIQFGNLPPKTYVLFSEGYCRMDVSRPVCDLYGEVNPTTPVRVPARFWLNVDRGTRMHWLPSHQNFTVRNLREEWPGDTTVVNILGEDIPPCPCKQVLHVASRHPKQPSST
jgi:hypothetical protein